jgi:hypothetical protein
MTKSAAAFARRAPVLFSTPCYLSPGHGAGQSQRHVERRELARIWRSWTAVKTCPAETRRPMIEEGM